MFHNIFQKTKKKQKKLPVVIADIHEKNSLVIAELHSSSEVSISLRAMKIADYIIGDTAVERKTVSDFVSSMISKRLIQQLRQMQEYQKKILIIEGNLNEFLKQDTNMAKALRGFVLSISLNHQIPIIQTKDYRDTSRYIITLAKRQLKKTSEISFHSKIPKIREEQKSYILESFPNIGPTTAKKLLEKFKTLSNIFNSPEDDLRKTLKSRTEEFKELIDN